MLRADALRNRLCPFKGVPRRSVKQRAVDARSAGPRARILEVALVVVGGDLRAARASNQSPLSMA
eukprot:8269052-Alexandrium_andersonii.AAC.1